MPLSRYPQRNRSVPKRFEEEVFKEENDRSDDDTGSDVEEINTDDEIKLNEYDDENGNEYEKEWLADGEEVEPSDSIPETGKMGLTDSFSETEFQTEEEEDTDMSEEESASEPLLESEISESEDEDFQL
jgi:hypothetical protein